jgi:predicted site-specific integrase-resolvase
MKLSEWAKKQRVSYRTAWRWFKAGILPVPSKQLPNGTIILFEREEKPLVVAIYARVSSSDQKKDLDRQVARLVTFANERSLSISKTVIEIGSGLNGHRPKLMKLLADKAIGIVLVEHRDRLMRFGAEYVESALAAEGRKLLVVDEGELKDDPVQDMIEVLTSFCARLYGRRSAKNKAKKALETIQNENC